jgi:ribonuclease VapC
VIVDTSAIIAILSGEPDAERYARLIAGSDQVRISAATYVETGVVVDGLKDPTRSGALDVLIESSGISIEPVTASQARIARMAYQRFGKTSGHPARLNLGDCFAYALARELGEPLLFKGDDFSLTDIALVGSRAERRRLSELVAAYGPFGS